MLGVSLLYMGILTQPAFAWFKVCNKSGTTIYVAQSLWKTKCKGYDWDSCTGGYAKKRFIFGWDKITPGSCKQIYGGNLQELAYTNFYLAIKRKNGKVITDDDFRTQDGFTGGWKLCVHPYKIFSISIWEDQNQNNCRNARNNQPKDWYVDPDDLIRVPFLNIKNAGKWSNYTFNFR